MVKERVKRPKKHKVVLHNDDFTPMEFVVEILESVYNRTSAESTRIMLTVQAAMADIFIMSDASPKPLNAHPLGGDALQAAG